MPRSSKSRPQKTCPLVNQTESAWSMGGLTQREIVEDRTVRPLVSVAGADQSAERSHHGRHFGDALLEFVDVRLGDAFHLAARTAAIAPERQQGADFLYRKAEPPRPPDEAQLVDVALAVIAIGVAAALRGTQQADRLIMADHLCVDPARRGRRADIHVEHPLDLPIMGRFRA